MPKPIRPLPPAIAKEQYKAYSIEVTVKPAGRGGYVQDVSFKVRRTTESGIDYAGTLGRSFESAAGATFAALTNARNWIDEQRTLTMGTSARINRLKCRAHDGDRQ